MPEKVRYAHIPVAGDVAAEVTPMQGKPYIAAICYVFSSPRSKK